MSPSEREEAVSKQLAADLARIPYNRELDQFQKQAKAANDARNIELREAREEAIEAERQAKIHARKAADQKAFDEQIERDFFAANPLATKEDFAAVKTELRRRHMVEEAQKDPVETEKRRILAAHVEEYSM